MLNALQLRDHRPCQLLRRRTCLPDMPNSVEHSKQGALRGEMEGLCRGMTRLEALHPIPEPPGVFCLVTYVLSPE